MSLELMALGIVSGEDSLRVVKLVKMTLSGWSGLKGEWVCNDSVVKTVLSPSCSPEISPGVAPSG